MKIDPADFAQLVNRAVQDGRISHMRPVIEKELLHYDILFCLDQSGLLDTLVFQGGTALRLCYGGNRFSEDLDFAGGTDFSSQRLAYMKQCIEHYIGGRYGLTVTVKEPATQNTPNHDFRISKWQIAIITAPERKNIPKQRIKIGIANITAYTRNTLPLRHNYDFLPDGYNDVLIYTETLDEIMADKLVAFPATQKYVRYRDIWDLAWLHQQGAKLNPEWVRQKITEYRLLDFEARLEQRIASLHTLIEGREFYDEMRRFLPSDVFERTSGRDKFKGYLITTLTDLFAKLRSALYGAAGSHPFEL